MINCVRCGKENERQICEACMEKRRKLRFISDPVKAAVKVMEDQEVKFPPVIVKRKPGRPRRNA